MHVEQVITVVGGCVLTFFELEKLLDTLKTNDIGIRDRVCLGKEGENDRWPRVETAEPQGFFASGALYPQRVCKTTYVLLPLLTTCYKYRNKSLWSSALVAIVATTSIHDPNDCIRTISVHSSASLDDCRQGNGMHDKCRRRCMCNKLLLSFVEHCTSKKFSGSDSKLEHHSSNLFPYFRSFPRILMICCSKSAPVTPPKEFSSASSKLSFSLRSPSFEKLELVETACYVLIYRKAGSSCRDSGMSKERSARHLVGRAGEGDATNSSCSGRWHF